MQLAKSETIQNLVNAFAGESQARNRYTFYAKEALKEGYNEISDIFAETASNEQEHAKIFYKFIPAEHYLINAEYPFFLGKTYDNLLAAADAEHEEWSTIYKNSAEIAAEEGSASMVAYWLSLMPADRAAQIQRKMLSKPSSLEAVSDITDTQELAQ